MMASDSLTLSLPCFSMVDPDDPSSPLKWVKECIDASDDEEVASYKKTGRSSDAGLVVLSKLVGEWSNHFWQPK